VALHKYDPPELVQASQETTNTASSSSSNASASSSTKYHTPCKVQDSIQKRTTDGAGTTEYDEDISQQQDNFVDSPISIMSESSRRDLTEEFEASLAATTTITTTRPKLITGASNWADDSDEDDDFL
jgi:hypothetical protein